MDIYCVGIKGTGVYALVELLHSEGLSIRGSDRDEVFYMDAILAELGIPYYRSFSVEHINAGIKTVIYSAAYSPETNPELAEARRLGIPLVKYTDALGEYSAVRKSSIRRSIGARNFPHKRSNKSQMSSKSAMKAFPGTWACGPSRRVARRVRQQF
ncbi:MAG: Mur ligase domain-containing protein [Treponema sp.]|jgi:hypothetical protein|nr:Mur ligase domain-containing protein [Treponema sp.]